MNYWKLNKVLHRDIGYFLVGLCIIYSISGIAINHIDDWDPNYAVKAETLKLDVTRINACSDELCLEDLFREFDLDVRVKSYYSPTPDQLKVFIKNGSVTINTNNGEALLEKVSRRVILYEFNVLHYNNLKGFWTWFSDLFAVGLIFLAISGLFIVRGKNSFQRRGVWFVLAGIIVPVLFLLL